MSPASHPRRLRHLRELGRPSRPRAAVLPAPLRRGGRAGRSSTSGAGSARHAIAFAEWGMSVDAVDPDDSMLAQAEANVADAAERIAEAGGELRLVRGGFGELAALGLGRADALTVHRQRAAARRGLGRAARGARGLPRGAAARRRRWCCTCSTTHACSAASRASIPPIVREVPEGTRVFLRVIDYPAGGRVPRLRLRDADARRRRRAGTSRRVARRTRRCRSSCSAHELDGGGLRAHRGVRRRTTATRSSRRRRERHRGRAARRLRPRAAANPAVVSRPRTPGAVPGGTCARARRRRPRRARRSHAGETAASPARSLALELGVQVAQRQPGDVLVALVGGHLGDLRLDVVRAGAAQELAHAPSTPRSGSRSAASW